MTIRIPLDDLTSDQYDALCERAEQAEAERNRVQERACRTAENLRRAEQRAERAEAARDQARAENADARAAVERLKLEGQAATVGAVPVPAETFAKLVKVAAHVSRGQGYAFNGGALYPDATARRALGALDDAGLLTLDQPQQPTT